MTVIFLNPKVSYSFLPLPLGQIGGGGQSARAEGGEDGRRPRRDEPEGIDGVLGRPLEPRVELRVGSVSVGSS